MQVNTFRINPTTDLTEIGVNMQIRDFSRTQNNDSVLYPSQNDIGLFPDDTLFPVYKMESKAILSDLINNVPLGAPLMISRRCLILFQRLKLPMYQVFPLKFIYKGNLNKDYVSFSIVKDYSFLNYISWEESLFYKTLNFHRVRVSEHKFKSIEELLLNMKAFEKEGFGLYPEVKIKYQNNFDLINFGRFPLPFGYLCSAYAKELIIESELTGFDFEPLPNDIFAKI